MNLRWSWPFSMISFLSWNIIRWPKLRERFIHTRAWNTFEFLWLLFKHSAAISMSKNSISVRYISWFSQSTISLNYTVSWSILTRSRNLGFSNKQNIYLLKQIFMSFLDQIFSPLMTPICWYNIFLMDSFNSKVYIFQVLELTMNFFLQKLQ